MKHSYQFFAKHSNQHDIEAPITATVISNHVIGDNCSLLDVGCGSGALLRKITQRIRNHFTVDYIDPDPTILEIFRDTLSNQANITLREEYNHRAEDVLGTLRRQYDFILCGHSLYYTDTGIIFSLLQKLTQNGLLIIHLSRSTGSAVKMFFSTLRFSEETNDFLYQHQIQHSLFSQKFLLDVMPIKRYLQDPSFEKGRQFLDFFLYGKQPEEVSEQLSAILALADERLDGTAYLSGKSDIYVLTSSPT